MDERPALKYQIGKCEGTLDLSEVDLVHDVMHEEYWVTAISQDGGTSDYHD